MLLCLLLLFTLAVAASVDAAVTIDWVTVGDPGNGADSNGFGAVAYEYRISKYEVTNAQYAEFLNQVAASDPNGLYATGMGSDPRGGITRNGSDGSYNYAVRSNMGDKPVVFVTHLDAQRFANWLHNGQGTGGTETGAYSVGGLAVHEGDASVWIATENEWYKAAYYDPTKDGTGGYWKYATRTDNDGNLIPATVTTAGVINNPGANVVNFRSTADWNGGDGNVTTVGSAGPLSASYYGTFDQTGNVDEWNEGVSGSSRGLRGGNWIANGFGGNSISSAWNFYYDPGTTTLSTVGFRLAGVVSVPEPSRVMLMAAGGAAWLLRRRRKPLAR